MAKRKKPDEKSSTNKKRKKVRKSQQKIKDVKKRTTNNNKKNIKGTIRKKATNIKRKKPSKKIVSNNKKQVNGNNKRKSTKVITKRKPVVKRKPYSEKPYLNIINVKTYQKSFKTKGDFVSVVLPKGIVKKYIEKNKIVKGKTKITNQIFPEANEGDFKLPKAFQIVFKIKHPEKGSYYTSKISPPDMEVTDSNIRKYIKKLLNKYNSEMMDLILEKYDEEISPYSVNQVAIKFLY